MKFTGKKCPLCGKKGLHYANHAHAQGWKDYYRVECRFCHKLMSAEKLEKYFDAQKDVEEAEVKL